MVANEPFGTAWSHGGAVVAGTVTVVTLGSLLALLLVVLAIAAVSARLTRRDRRQVRPVPHPSVAPPTPLRPARPSAAQPPAFDLRLVAVEPVRGAYVLDGIVEDGAGALGPAGRPIAVRVRQPETADLDACIHGLLVQWAADDESVRVAVSGAETRRRASITNGGPVLHLELEALDDRSPAALGHERS